MMLFGKELEKRIQEARAKIFWDEMAENIKLERFIPEPVDIKQPLILPNLQPISLAFRLRI